MGEAEGENEKLALLGYAETDADKFLPGGETFGHADDHIVHQGTVETVHRTVTGKVGRAFELDLIVLNGDLDVGIDFLAHFTERSFNLHHVAGLERNADAGRKAYRQFTNS